MDFSGKTALSSRQNLTVRWLGGPATGLDVVAGNLSILIEVCQDFLQIHKKPAYTMYGQVLQFRPFQTNRALMCKIREQDKVSVLKHVLCSFMNTYVNIVAHENV